METSLYSGQYSLWKKYPQSKLAGCSRTSVSKLECAKVYTRYMEDAMLQKVQIVPKIPKTASSINHGGRFFIIYSRNKVTSSPKNCSFSYAPMIEYVASSILFFFKEPTKLKI